MAWTRKAPGGKWKGCWRDHLGKERSRTLATKTAALKYARKMEAEKDAGVRRDHELGKMTVGEWLQEWMATSPGVRDRSHQHREGLIRLHILPTALARIPLYRLAPHDVDRWVANRTAAGASPANIRWSWIHLNTALNRAVDREIIPRNPAKRVQVPEYNPKGKVVLRPGEIIALSEAVGPIYRALILVLGFGGIRISEAAGLTVGDFDEEHGELHVYRQLHYVCGTGLAWGQGLKSETRKKTGSSVALHDFVVQAVREHIDAGWTSTFDGQTLIFSMSRQGLKGRDVASGVPITNTKVARMLKPVAKSMGLPPAFHTHNLRDSCATNMLANGASVQDVADQLGDKAETVLEAYIHSSPESRRAALSRVATVALGGETALRPLRPALPGEVDGVVEGELVGG